jgi:glyoxylase-like metal-dependent hydrolase (beta-lactamase superfamily II)
MVAYCAGLISAWTLWRLRAEVFGSAEIPSVRVMRYGAAATAAIAAVWILGEPWRLAVVHGDGRLHVTFIDVGQGDAVLVRFPRGGTLLVDAGGLPGLSSFDIGDRIVGAALRHAGVRRLDTAALTHGDADHIGGAARVLERFGDLKVSKKPWPGKDEAFNLSLTAIDDGTRVETDGATLRAIHTPGHARDHLCYYLAEEKALFTGDLVLGAGTTVVPEEGGGLIDYMVSLKKLLLLDLAVIYPAHGPAIHNPYEKLRDYIAHRELREQQILEAMRAGLTEVPAMVKRIYTDVPEFLHGAAGNSVLSHLSKLKKEGVIRQEGERWFLI